MLFRLQWGIFREEIAPCLFALFGYGFDPEGVPQRPPPPRPLAHVFVDPAPKRASHAILGRSAEEIR